MVRALRESPLARALVPLGVLACASSPAVAVAPPIDTDPAVLGSVTNAVASTCPDGSPAGAACKTVTVTCPKLDDLDAVVAVSEPASTALGTVYLHDNVGGTAFLDAGFVSAYLAKGLRVVQVRWQNDWETSRVGLKHATCRYSTLLAWAFTNVHGADRTKGFCAQSWGGGSGGLAFALADYGAGDFLDAVTLSAGPPFARLDVGCDPNAAPRSVCAQIPAAPLTYTTDVLAIVSEWEVAPTCGKPNPSPLEVARWQSDSVLASSAVTSFPNTSFAAWYCMNGADATVGQGSLFFDAIQASKTVHCVTGGAAGGMCTGQTPWPSALPDMVDDLAARCTPQH